MNPDLVIAGNLLVDDVVFDSGQTRMGEAGGAVLYAALAASLWGPEVGCMSWSGQDYPQAQADQLFEWKARTGQVVDPTGAGDAFAGGFLTALLAGEAGEAALGRGVVSASFALEGWGPEGLLAATPEGARQRLHQWRGGA